VSEFFHKKTLIINIVRFDISITRLHSRELQNVSI